MKVNRELIEYLKTIIPLIQAKNCKIAYISKECPVCKYKSKSSYVFRYDVKKKVGKSFCCGNSFKELIRLKDLRDKKINLSIEEIKQSFKNNDKTLLNLNRKERRMYIRNIYLFEEKRNEMLNESRFKKYNSEDLSLPF